MATLNLNHEKKARRIAKLLTGYMRDTLTSVEHDELDEWVGASDKNMRLFEELTDERRVSQALELFNDNSANLVTTLKTDKEFKFDKKVWWFDLMFMKGVMYGIAANGIIELIKII
jgi:hypothetical protein